MDQSKLDAQRQTFSEELRQAGSSQDHEPEILRSVLAGCGDCIKILDLDGRLQFMSEGGKRVMEVENFGLLKGCPWPDFWEGQGNIDARAALAAAKKGRVGHFKGAANTAKGNARYWDVTVSPIMASDGHLHQILSISRDITAEHELQERQKWISGELVHRIKNTLSIAIAIANQTLRGKYDAETERKALTGRLHALSEAQNVLVKSQWTLAPIQTVIDGALQPFRSDHNRFRMIGPEMNLGSRQALTLALAIHELATNATKYGSLTNTDGYVELRWQHVGETFEFSWIEFGGPKVIEPTNKGFGTKLIKDLLASDLNGKVVMTYHPSGLECSLSADFSSLSGEFVSA